MIVRIQRYYFIDEKDIQDRLKELELDYTESNIDFVAKQLAKEYFKFEFNIYDINKFSAEVVDKLN